MIVRVGPAMSLILLLLSSSIASGQPSLAGVWESRSLLGDAAPQNLTAALHRLVELLGASGGAILALVWARVALSWFSPDITKKIQAKERARDALIGTLIFAAALTGLVWGLAQWVLTGG